MRADIMADAARKGWKDGPELIVTGSKRRAETPINPRRLRGTDRSPPVTQRKEGTLPLVNEARWLAPAGDLGLAARQQPSVVVFI
ncbi:hypothetical protein, partial [Mesorhizobium caraganae]|uniref:hypothetical protein n=1 Tax=Mesorhizobium caraganae TaxID=483206 RepID=UPI0033398096